MDDGFESLHSSYFRDIILYICVEGEINEIKNIGPRYGTLRFIHCTAMTNPAETFYSPIFRRLLHIIPIRCLPLWVVSQARSATSLAGRLHHLVGELVAGAKTRMKLKLVIPR